MKRIIKNFEEKLCSLYSQDIEYHDYKNCKRYLQILFPYKQSMKIDEKYPLILFIPGSAWHKQEMYNDIPQYAQLAKRGYVVAAMQYRESEISPYPAQIEDVYHALKFIPQVAETFHIDLDNIYLMGNSSGAHIAMMTALLHANGAYPEMCEVKGIILESGSTDILICSKAILPPWMKVRPSAALLGVDKIEGNEELARRASCVSYITKEIRIPPVLLIHSELDSIVSVENSRYLYERLTETGHIVEYYELEGCSAHGGSIFWEEGILNIVQKFCMER